MWYSCMCAQYNLQHTVWPMVFFISPTSHNFASFFFFFCYLLNSLRVCGERLCVSGGFLCLILLILFLAFLFRLENNSKPKETADCFGTKKKNTRKGIQIKRIEGDLLMQT